MNRKSERAIGPFRGRRGDDGFTLIELLTVIVLIPLVVGAISVALLSVITQQNTATSKVSNSADASLLSATFVKDVQSAQLITTNASPSSATYPYPVCITTTPIVSLEWPSTSSVVVSYAVVKQSNTLYALFRYYCQASVQTTSVVAHNVQSGLVPALTGQTCANNQCHPINDATYGVKSGWVSTAGVSSVQLAVQAPQTTNGGTGTYKYSLTAVPRASNNLSRGSNGGGHAPLVMLGNANPDISCGGHDSVQVNGTADINSPSTAIATNGGGSVSATNIYTNTPSPSGAFQGNNITPATPTGTGVQTSDPYFGLIPPATGLPIANSYHDGDTYPGTYGNLTVRTSGGYEGPGLYTNGLSIGSGQTLASGIYVIEQDNHGNALTLNGNGQISSATGGVLIYIFSGAVSISGNGGLDLQPLSNPPTGLPSGLTIWMDSSDNDSMTIQGSVHGANATIIGGTIYAPQVSLSAAGNGQVNVGSLVANQMSCQGGGNSGKIVIG